MDTDMDKDKELEKEKAAREKLDFKNSIEVYDRFIKKTTNLPAKIDGADGKAMKAIVDYFHRSAEDKSPGILPEPDTASKALEYIFEHWQKLDHFQQKQLKLIYINQNLSSIISQIKNGKSKSPDQVLADSLADIAKYQANQ
jgi:hypothetical protein